MNWLNKLFGKKSNSYDFKNDELLLRIEKLKQEVFQKEQIIKSLTEKDNNFYNNEYITGTKVQNEAKEEETDGNSEEYIKKIRTQLDEKSEHLKKLKIELAEKEDEADDLAEELKRSNKKVQEAKAECNRFQTEKQELESNYNAKKQELDFLLEKNEKTEADLKLEKTTTEFINEILNAPDADDNSALGTKEWVDKVVNFVDNRVIDVLRNENGITENILQQISKNLQRWAAFQCKTWIKGKTVIAFVGEFSAGKTSIVNRLLSQDRDDAAYKMPISSTPTTAIATYISYGKEAKAQFTDINGDLKKISLVTFNQFNKASLERVNVTKLVSNFVMKYNNENLLNLSILDTPGFSSNDTEDKRRTVEVIKESSALFWVLDAHTGEINERSIRIIKEYLGGLPLYIVINKVDGKSPNERQQILEKVKVTIERNEIPIKKILLFSQKEPLSILMNEIKIFPPQEQVNNTSEEIEYFLDNPQELGRELDNEVEIGTMLEVLIKRYEKANKKYHKDLHAAKLAVSRLENEIEKLSDKIKTEINLYNQKGERMLALDTGEGWFTSKHQIKNPEEFWQLDGEKTDHINNMINISDERIDCYLKLQDENANKEENEYLIKENNMIVSNLIKILRDYNQLLKFRSHGE